jgi:hypothetical protein
MNFPERITVMLRTIGALSALLFLGNLIALFSASGAADDAVAARYHVRQRTPQFFQRSTITYVRRA